MKKIIIFSFIILFTVSYTVKAQESVEQYLMKLTKPGVDDYVKLLYEGSHENKLLAVKKLRELGVKSEEVVDALIFGLQQGTIFVQRENGKVINDFWDVRAASAQALGDIGDPKVLPNLYQALRYDYDSYVRSTVAIAIGKIGRKESISELNRAIITANRSGQDDILIRACVEAIGNIGDKEGFVPLLEVVRGKYRRNVRLAARDALKKIRW